MPAESTGRLLARARALSWERFGKRVVFYLPGMFVMDGVRGRYPAISITGPACGLGCDHCSGEILKSMPAARLFLRSSCTEVVPVVVATTPAGAERLAGRPLPSNVRVEAVGEGERVPAGAVLEVIRGTGARVALCEGGPHLFGELLRARLVDELFLTLAPQAYGRDASLHRLGLVEGTSFGEGQGRWAQLASVRRAGDDLFLRYRFEP